MKDGENALGLFDLKSCDATDLTKLGFPDIIVSEDRKINGKSIHEACDYLMSRDHNKIYKLKAENYSPGQMGLTTVPSRFISKLPELHGQDPETYQAQVEMKNDKVPKELKKDMGQVTGDHNERCIFEALSSYFEDRDVVLIHSHVFRKKDPNEDNEERYKFRDREKDFFVLSLELGCIFHIEVKTTLTKDSFSKLNNQLKDGKKWIDRVFSSINQSSWKYCGISCFFKKPEKDQTFACSSFLAIGPDGLSKIVSSLEKEIKSSRQWDPNDHLDEFKDICKAFFYVAQGDKRAPVTRRNEMKNALEAMDKASTPESLIFWTPQQLNALEFLDQPHMALFGYYGTGKTILLLERAKYLAEHGERVVFGICVYHPDNEPKKTILQERVQKQLGSSVEVVLLRDYTDFLALCEHKTHVIIDEFFEMLTIPKEDGYTSPKWNELDMMTTTFTNIKHACDKLNSLWIAIRPSSTTNEQDYYKEEILKKKLDCFEVINLDQVIRNPPSTIELLRKYGDTTIRNFEEDSYVHETHPLNNEQSTFPEIITCESVKAALIDALKETPNLNCFVFIDAEVDPLNAIFTQRDLKKDAHAIIQSAYDHLQRPKPIIIFCDSTNLTEDCEDTRRVIEWFDKDLDDSNDKDLIIVSEEDLDDTFEFFKGSEVNNLIYLSFWNSEMKEALSSESQKLKNEGFILKPDRHYIFDELVTRAKAQLIVRVIKNEDEEKIWSI